MKHVLPGRVIMAVLVSSLAPVNAWAEAIVIGFEAPLAMAVLPACGFVVRPSDRSSDLHRVSLGSFCALPL